MSNPTPAPRESAVVRAILTYLKRLPSCYAEKNHGDVFGQNGRPDIFGCLNGRFLAFEVKRPGVRDAEPLQKVMLARWRKAGAVAAVVHSVEEVQAELRAAGLLDTAA